MKKLVLLSILFYSLGCTHTHKREPNSEGLGQISDSDNLSQVIRSNTKHYWGWIQKNEKNFNGIKDVMNFKGFVFGDPHMGNFAPYLMKNSLGHSVQFVAIDFDDVGEAPFIYDIARFIIASEAVDKKSIVKKDILEAYVHGLNNTDADITDRLPSIVLERLALTQKDVAKLQDDYADDKTSKGKFKIKKDSLESYDGSLKSSIETLLKPLKLLDIATRIVVRGGSKNALRLWALTKNEKSGIIYEFKEWQQTGVESYSPQSSIEDRLPSIYDIFWPGYDSSSYKIVSLKDQLFWLREKHEPLLDIPYSANSDVERVFIAKYASACAMALGQIHGRQEQGKKFAKYIKGIKLSGLKEIIEPITDSYLDLVEAEFKKNTK
jgi:hypothetical protein